MKTMNENGLKAESKCHLAVLSHQTNEEILVMPMPSGCTHWHQIRNWMAECGKEARGDVEVDRPWLCELISYRWAPQTPIKDETYAERNEALKRVDDHLCRMCDVSLYVRFEDDTATSLRGLANGLCKAWTGRSAEELQESGAAESLWHTGVCSQVTAKRCEGGIGTDFNLFAGVRLEGDEVPEATGVAVRLHDSYGNICIQVETVGNGNEHRLAYESQFNERVPISHAVARIRALVEIACQDLTRRYGGGHVTITGGR